jgi:NADH-quinone oxidoreductase subunit K
MIPLSYYVILALGLFFIGIFGMLFRRNLIVMCACIEIVINALIVLFAAISHFNGDTTGYIVVFFLIAMAAAEAAVGLTLIVLLYKKYRAIHSEELGELKG